MIKLTWKIFNGKDRLSFLYREIDVLKHFFVSVSGGNIFEKEFHQPEAFVRMGNSIMAIPIPEERLKGAEEAKGPGRDAAARSKHRKPEIDGH